MLNFLFAAATTDPLPHVHANQASLTTILNIVMGILGGIAVIAIMVGAITYLTAQGEPEKISRGRKTVTYSLVGLVVIVTASAIVNFVVAKAP